MKNKITVVYQGDVVLKILLGEDDEVSGLVEDLNDNPLTLQNYTYKTIEVNKTLLELSEFFNL